MKSLSPEEQKEVEKLLDKMDDDDDVVNVFHNMNQEETEEAQFVLTSLATRKPVPKPSVSLPEPLR